jgi:hypothetical protein
MSEEKETEERAAAAADNDSDSVKRFDLNFRMEKGAN